MTIRKRFTGFLICSALLFIGLFAAGEQFPTYAQMLTALYAAFLGGQTATDWQEAKKRE